MCDALEGFPCVLVSVSPLPVCATLCLRMRALSRMRSPVLYQSEACVPLRQ